MKRFQLLQMRNIDEWTNDETRKVFFDIFEGLDCGGDCESFKFSTEKVKNIAIEWLKDESEGLALDKVNWSEIVDEIASEHEFRHSE